MSKKEKLERLRAWAHWAMLNPLNEDQKEMAESVTILFNELREVRARMHEQYSQLLTEQSQRLDELAMDAKEAADDWREMDISQISLVTER